MCDCHSLSRTQDLSRSFPQLHCHCQAVQQKLFGEIENTKIRHLDGPCKALAEATRADAAKNEISLSKVSCALSKTAVAGVQKLQKDSMSLRAANHVSRTAHVVRSMARMPCALSEPSAEMPHTQTLQAASDPCFLHCERQLGV
jgi:hypothetical protein